MNIAILLPTIYRKVGLTRAMDTLFSTAYDYDFTVIVAREWDDYGAAGVCKLYDGKIRQAVCKKSQQGPAYGWNTALAAAPDFEGYFLASDDIEFLPGWLDAVMVTLEEELDDSGLVGVNDSTGKYERVGWCTHYFMTRDFIVEHNGGVAACPHYFSNFTDVEIAARAKRVHKFAYSKNARIIHHWKEIPDEAYQRGDERRMQAREIYLIRKAKGFPDDYEAVIT